MKTEKTPDLSSFETAETAPRPSFITPEMIKKNPLLEVAGIFAGDPMWQEVREEIKRNRERDQQNEEQGNK